MYFNVASVVLQISWYLVKIVARYASQIVLKVEKSNKEFCNASQNLFSVYFRYVKMIKKFILFCLHLSQSFNYFCALEVN